MKDAPHVEAVIFDRARVCVTIFSWVLLICGPHLNLVSIWTPSTLMSDLGAFVSCSMVTLVFFCRRRLLGWCEGLNLEENIWIPCHPQLYWKFIGCICAMGNVSLTIPTQWLHGTKLLDRPSRVISIKEAKFLLFVRLRRHHEIRVTTWKGGTVTFFFSYLIGTKIWCDSGEPFHPYLVLLISSQFHYFRKVLRSMIVPSPLKIFLDMRLISAPTLWIFSLWLPRTYC